MKASIRDLWPLGIPGEPSSVEWTDMEFFKWPLVYSNNSFHQQVEIKSSLSSLSHDLSKVTANLQQSDEEWFDLVLDQCLIDSANLVKEDSFEVRNRLRCL